ncbi:methionyl-tRNA formyltransferase [Blattabacterium cuenoti]|uniref:methionyl-tRNA formyltransferase n=1 Tax=Blattabacterium cuenoti TaxID=1653831 RepID=UPI001EEB667C|nr:methionyl-tRNA formyltransferase [Blattabacterium cuenoti]
MNLFFTKTQDKNSEFKLQINYMKKFPKIIFIGSDKFSVSSLKELYIKKYNIVGIITNPDNKKYNPVKIYSLEKKITLLQPKKLLDPIFIKKIKIINADLYIVVSFKFLPKKIWNLPKLGTINLHPSLLPKYRGAAPINWVIINGENRTGLTVFFVEEKIDCGKIILQKEIKIEDNETAGELQEKLQYYSGSIIISSINKILKNKNFSNERKKMYYIKNDDKIHTKNAPKIYTKDCRIKWSLSIDTIYNKIRGLSPSPSAWTLLYLNKKFYRFKIFFVKKEKKIHNYSIGLVFINLYNMFISVKEGFINILECQIEGKKKMNIKKFINGIKIKKNLFVK